MAKFYIANENGDWWVIDTETGAGSTLFVISETDLARAVADENPELDLIELSDTDKLDRVIAEHGTATSFEFEVGE